MSHSSHQVCERSVLKIETTNKQSNLSVVVVVVYLLDALHMTYLMSRILHHT